MEQRRTKDGTASRRSFFRTVAAGVGAAGTLAIGAASPTEAASGERRADGSLGYRETEHVKRVYASQRF